MVTTSEAIVAEVVYVLSSPRLYNLIHADIAARLAPILTLRGLRMENKRVVQRALQLYARHQFLDFEDALAVAHMEHHRIGEIYSYDRDFDRLPEFRATPGLRRLEPSR